MTGYGKGEALFGEDKIVAEIKSLNAKITDVRIKSSVPLGQKELELRNIVQNAGHRGKFELTLLLAGIAELETGTLNKVLISKYLEELQDIVPGDMATSGEILGSVLRLPNIVMTEDSTIPEPLWQAICHSVEDALTKLKSFRQKEGESILQDMHRRIEIISSLLERVTPAEEGRLEALKKRLKQRIDEYLGNESVDQNRFEQELIFYIEKLDITEEKVRLAQHCRFFLDILEQDQEEKGKKLMFICQEIGREINTMGAKAQWSPIQKIVVSMKDELEKIKEQAANTL